MASSSKKTQEELEQTVKGYQLDAVEIKVDQAIAKLDTIINQTNGLVTPAQLEDAKIVLKDYVKEEIKKVHLTYSPLKTKINALNATLGGAVVLQLVYIAFNLFGGK